MKVSTLTTVLTGMFLVFISISCSQGQYITGSGNYITKDIEISPFNAITLSGSADIIYQQDANTHFEIYGSDNIISILKIYVDKNTLFIKYPNNINIRDRGTLEIRVSSPELNSMGINGSGNIQLTNGIQTKKNVEVNINGSGNIQGQKIVCQKTAISINGSGNIRFQQIQSQICSAHITGSGNILFSGKTDNADFRIVGSGNINALELQAKDVSSSVTGSGDISCHVSEKLSAQFTGGGSLSYKGNPQEVNGPQKKLHKLD